MLPKAVAAPWGLGFGCSRAVRLWPEGWLGAGGQWPEPGQPPLSWRGHALWPRGAAAAASLVSSSVATRKV